MKKKIKKTVKSATIPPQQRQGQKTKNKSLNAFHSANYRRRKKGLPELTYDDYCKQRVAMDSSGRFHPRKQEAIGNAISVFGKNILKEKKKCIKCAKKKLLIDFSMRYAQKSILNVCKDCEQIRQKKYWKT